MKLNLFQQVILWAFLKWVAPILEVHQEEIELDYVIESEPSDELEALIESQEQVKH